MTSTLVAIRKLPLLLLLGKIGIVIGIITSNFLKVLLEGYAH